MKRFGKDVIGGTMRLFNLDDVQSRMITRLFEQVQKRVEGYYFDARRNTFEYDNVLNDQRELIYKERNKILDGENVHEQVLKSFPDLVSGVVSKAIDRQLNWTEWDLEKANQILSDKLFGTDTSYLDKENTEKASFEDILEMVLDAVAEQYEEKAQKLIADGFDFHALERDILLSMVDRKWVEHIDAMVNLRNGIGLRGYGGKDPLVEYRREALGMYNDMIESISTDTALFLFKVKIERENVQTIKSTQAVKKQKPIVQTTAKQINMKNVGRNEPCPCGSGKKYKNCCGA
jgi:preprotein translocase subunit SecA